MLILILKGYGRRKPIEKSIPEVIGRDWDIAMRVPTIQRLNHITDVLEDNKEWAFVWSQRCLTDNYYYLNKYIMFEAAHSQTWFCLNLGDGVYHITNEDSNEYRDRNLEVRDEYDLDDNYEVIMNIDNGVH